LDNFISNLKPSPAKKTTSEFQAALVLAPKTQIKNTQMVNSYNFAHMNLQTIVDHLNNLNHTDIKMKDQNVQPRQHLYKKGVAGRIGLLGSIVNDKPN